MSRVGAPPEGPAVRGGPVERAISTSIFWFGLTVLVVSAWWFGRGLWFYSDEWNVIAAHHAGNWTRGFNGQWLLIPTLVFRVLLEIFGLFTYWPFRLVGLMAYTTLVILFRAWAIKRVRPAVATLAALAIAWYPTSWNVVMMPLLMNFTIPVAMLFAAWLLLERRDPRADLGVAACLVVAVLSSNVGLVVCLVIGVEFLVSRTDWRRFWIFVPAAAVWVPWFLIWYEPISERAGIRSATHWGIGLTENYAKGFFSGWRAGQWIWLAALAGIGVWALARRRWSPRAIGILAGTVFFVAGASFRAADFHIPIPPDPNWYLWFYSVLVAALLVELLRGVRVPRTAVTVVGVVVLVGAVNLHGSLADFHDNGVQLARNARTWYAAADALGDRAPQDATLAVNIVQLPVADYTDLRRDMGSLAPGVTLADMGDEGTRRSVDTWMAMNLGTRVQPGAGPPGECRAAPGVSGAAGAELPAGATLRVDGHGDGAEVYLRRFAAGFPTEPVGRVASGETAHLVVPADNSDLPWYARVVGRADVEICDG